jgi:hypothetical protein
MHSWRLVGETLVNPVGAFRELVESPRSLVALVLLVLAQLAIPAALLGRVDVRREVLADLQGSGKLADTSDRELGEKVDRASKLVVATYAATGLFGPPFRALLLTIGLWLWGRYLGARPAFGTLWSLSIHAQLPLAVRALARGAVLASQPFVYPSQIDGALPSGLWAVPGLHLPALATSLAGGVDFFLLWTAVLLAIALCTSSKLSAWRAGIGMGVAYAVWAVVVFVGLPLLGGA